MPFQSHCSCTELHHQICGTEKLAIKFVIHLKLYFFSRSIKFPPFSATSDPYKTSNICSREVLFILLVHARWHKGMPSSVT